METKLIEERIRDLTAELHTLEVAHNALVQQNQQTQAQFQQQVAKNQTRYAQIQGALGELNQLQTRERNNNEPVLDDLLSGRGTRKVVNKK